jgi:NAD(P)-dependent dehydrogenase (short-subunit alcohol dehydrogenase family)
MRVAVITGGGSGIGAAVAKRLALDAGMKVVLAGRREDLVREVAASITSAGGSASFVKCDVTKSADVDALARAAGATDVLINNAGIAKSMPLAKMDEAFWNEHLGVNLTGTFLCTKAFLPAMMDRGWGRVINVASVAGKTGWPYTSAYCASKAGVLGFTRAIALECARKGVTVNAVCPGWVETDMADRAVSNIEAKTKMSSDAARATLEQQSPQNRMMTSDEVAGLIAYLASDAAAGITAQAINLDGGTLQS